MRSATHLIARAPAVILSKAEHQVVTNLLRAELPYGEPHNSQKVVAAYKRVYVDILGKPRWFQEAKAHLGSVGMLR